jgi:diguanylate cyclase (GGDEF)-like protein
VTVLEQAAVVALEGHLDNALRQQAEREAHKLAGAVGTFGFAEGSRLAREIEQLLQAGRSLGQPQLLRLSELVVALRQELERAPVGPPEATPVSGDASPRLLVVDSHTELTERLVVEAATRGIRVELATELSTAREALVHAPPNVVLLDPSVSGDTGQGLALLAELTTHTPPVPVLVLTAQDRFIDRVEVARLGSRGFLQKPMPASQILEAVRQLLQQLQAPRARVLAVDDDPHVLAVLRALLEPHDFRLTTLSDPRQFWETLEAVSPDLLMLDVDMPHLGGIALCRVVRNDPRWRELPVLFLTASTDADTVQRVFAAGADDYVSKPVLGPELRTRITNRLERTRLLRSTAETDVATGLTNRSKSVQALGRFLRLAGRYNQPLSLAVLELDHFTQINDTYGHAAGDDVLRRVGGLLLQSFRSEDVVARWGREEFVVGMYGMRRDSSVHRLAEVLEMLRHEEFSGSDGVRFQVTFSAGVAEYPVDGTDLQTVYHAADQARYQAREAGRNRVLPAGWRPNQAQESESAEVVLVDDDETLAGLLLHTLETRGYHAIWLRDGQTAVDALSGSQPRLRARVVLLDVDLPGLDGLSVLRRLAHDGVVRYTQVIMLTFRSAENEVMTALELGAFDHIAKPFSIPVLMQRLRRTFIGVKG